MKTSFKAVVLALSMIAGSAFAASDLSSLTDLANTGAFSDAAATGALVAGLTLDGSSEDNLAVIAQFGTTGNYATIDQTGTGGNVAVILQDSANSANSAAIVQNGTLNIAKINQR